MGALMFSLTTGMMMGTYTRHARVAYGFSTWDDNHVARLIDNDSHQHLHSPTPTPHSLSRCASAEAEENSIIRHTRLFFSSVQQTMHMSANLIRLRPHAVFMRTMHACDTIPTLACISAQGLKHGSDIMTALADARSLAIRNSIAQIGTKYKTLQ